MTRQLVSIAILLASGNLYGMARLEGKNRGMILSDNRRMLENPRKEDVLSPKDLALWNAVENNDLKSAQAAIKEGAQVNVKFKDNPVLCCAVFEAKLVKNLDIVKLLIDNPATQLEAQDKHGRTPLLNAIPADGSPLSLPIFAREKEDLIQLVRVLLNAGADPEILRTRAGESRYKMLKKEFPDILLIIQQERTAYWQKQIDGLSDVVINNTHLVRPVVMLVATYICGDNTWRPEHTDKA